MSEINKQWLGLPLNLLWGYLAIAVFMTGDGFELAFLSHYIKSLGFTPAEASFAFTLYGLAAALSAWISGVVAEIITPQKTMLIGFVLWCVFHVLFLVFGLGQANYALMLLFYGIRGLAYPLFLYAFIVVIIHNVRSDKSSSALGWYWAVYSVGIGVAGSYIPSFTIPHIGEMGTLWLALAFCLAGGVIAMVSLRSVKTPTHMHNLSTREKFAELGRAATLLYTNRSILLSSMVRIINTLSLFGFAVIMPMMFVDELGFTTSEWLQVWAVFFFTTIFSNVFWGVVAEKMGWMRVVRWFGCIGMALSSLAFYYIPQHFGHNFAMALVPAIALGIFVAAFVPMAAVFPALEPRHKGAAISVYNLSAGLSNFLAPAIAVVLLPWFSTLGVVIAYTVLYLLAFVLCAFIRVTQPGSEKANSSKRGMAGLLNTPHPETLKE
ncbi:Ribitol/Xylitol/Arabitol transporter, MFS superfamily [Enterobacter hormaechei]|uniref:RbtT/DalT/CsbX family MFS transporter n=1 Tax=Enterobacter hormaechei TaxID=158836 RepID=UPI000A08087C|nr:RbtT/DalT/CsbX family MFS transporter [Enterobacter hormaechei]MCU2413620.1 RbtT/DalT/CsbX family MFS transporter [Enterobacter hormaechei subsp. steigerwaltii]HBM2440063.1 MFS transporter [Enterobacter hormaechei subsp. xiangfangensis]ELD3408025.1 MFS transporter [Enterobacter hormaechei]MCU2660632.1 RbtT/DalT/CsbX family MFS transporter [Enterobacter hormaechei subsp. steigerwaltii]MCU2975856.1 RbtT/DalT/CsbX family MFS transporter [Enterobacter hormaechei subsp. steigerwaltii]